MKTLTTSDRKALIRLASTMPVGSADRKTILKGLSRSRAVAAGTTLLNLPEYRVDIGPSDTTEMVAAKALKAANQGKLVRLSPIGTGRHHRYAIWVKNSHLEYLTGGRWGIEPLGQGNQRTIERIVREWVRDPR
jgi:hypothetical protein